VRPIGRCSLSNPVAPCQAQQRDVPAALRQTSAAVLEHEIGFRRGPVDDVGFWLATPVHTVAILATTLVIVSIAVLFEHRPVPWLERPRAGIPARRAQSLLAAAGAVACGCGFLVLADQALRMARRAKVKCVLVFVDLDGLKRVNDTRGHAAGDAVLRAVAERLRRAARAADISGRLGGEEFALLLPETGAEAAVVLAERLRRDVGALAVFHDGVVLRFTCSFGVAQHSPAMERLGHLLGAADKALYQAKALGRDRVEQHA